MKNMEIERKYLVRKESLPKGYSKYKHTDISQAFICLNPCIRIRKAGDKYFLTIKSKPNESKYAKRDLVRNEYEIEITNVSYKYLLKNCSGRIIKKTRYYIPYRKHTIELDIFKGDFKGLIYAEIEFNSIKDAERFVSPNWFYKDVTGINKYKNTSLSVCKNAKKMIKY